MLTRWVVLAALVAACGGSPDPCPHGSFAPMLSISNASMTVDVTTDPYGFVVHDSTGAVVLASSGAGSGDGYGALGWTTGNVIIKRFADPGYADFEASLDPWRDAAPVVSATSTGTEIDVTLETGEGCITITHA